MHSRSNATLVRTLLALVALAATGAFARADEWQVAKATGEVWITSATAQSVSLTTSSVLRPGEKIQTGKNGRVLLTRGAETILIAPNSLIGLPAPQTPDRTTTILQQAGSIVLEVEKRNVEHFEVETPFLAAVVKGTRFKVDVGQYGADVRVLSGSVNVSSFKSGQFALVSAGQEARVAAFGRGNLTLGGSGPIGPVLKGAPRSPTLQRVPVPAKGFNLPRAANTGPAPTGVPSNVAKLDGQVRIVSAHRRWKTQYSEAYQRACSVWGLGASRTPPREIAGGPNRVGHNWLRARQAVWRGWKWHWRQQWKWQRRQRK